MRRGLGFHNRRSPGVFSPSSLFQGGIVAGAWYDPSDSTTLFTTSAGTTPCAEPGAGALVVVGRMLDKSGNGNHANAADDTTTRPELSARVNLLTYTEQFDNGAWSKNAVSITKDSAVAPDGTTTADLMYPNTSGTFRWVYQTTTGIVSALWTRSVCAKAQNKSIIYIDPNGAGTVFAFFNLATGTVGAVSAGYIASIQSLGNGWYRCTMTNTAAATSSFGGVYGVADADGSTSVTANGTDGIFIWGADIRPTNIGANVPAYQRVADQYTYDTAGFPRYLRFDGVDDAMSTPANVNLSGTDKATVFVGERRIGTTGQFFAEFGTGTVTNEFFLGMNSSANDYWMSLGGVGSGITASSYASPRTDVLTALYDIAGATANDERKLRINGSQITFASNSGTVTGNFVSARLFIGARNTSSFWLNGYIYSLIVVGAASSAGQISSTEQWIAGKTGITI